MSRSVSVTMQSRCLPFLVHLFLSSPVCINKPAAAAHAAWIPVWRSLYYNNTYRIALIFRGCKFSRIYSRFEGIFLRTRVARAAWQRRMLNKFCKRFQIRERSAKYKRYTARIHYHTHACAPKSIVRHHYRENGPVPRFFPDPPLWNVIIQARSS